MYLCFVVSIIPVMYDLYNLCIAGVDGFFLVVMSSGLLMWDHFVMEVYLLYT